MPVLWCLLQLRRQDSRAAASEEHEPDTQLPAAEGQSLLVWRHIHGGGPDAIHGGRPQPLQEVPIPNSNIPRPTWAAATLPE